MSWTNPLTWTEPLDVLASHFNTHVRDNLNALREGAIAIASQAANDFLFAASATQLGRLAAVSGRTPQYNGSAWVMAVLASVEATWPVGSIYEAAVATNPATLLGIGTWSAYGAGRVLVAINAGDAEFDTLDETGGVKAHTLTTGEIPAHTHTQDAHNHTQNAHSHTLSGVGDDRLIDTDPAITVMNDSGTMTTSSVAATNIAATATNQSTGGGAAHSNLQPYVVIHRWKRTA